MPRAIDAFKLSVLLGLSLFLSKDHRILENDGKHPFILASTMRCGQEFVMCVRRVLTDFVINVE